ncbi:putative amidoligase enzyme-domain-containing protein [Tirmania nivea]|nr:putative amidoligase enzyme-domain-containing protein [Tirmania nivea]
MACSYRSFGIELECIVRHSEPASSYRQLHTKIARHIRRLTNLKIIHPQNPQFSGYLYGEIQRKDWMIVDDTTVLVKIGDFRYSREREHYPHMGSREWARLWCGAELVSPILTENNWEEVEVILNAIQTPPMAVIHNKTTSTHIHIGIQPHSAAPLDAEVGLYDIKRVAAIYYIFETYLNLLCPDHRVNRYCRRTRRSHFAKRNTQREFCQAIYELQRLGDVFDLMNCLGIEGDDELLTGRYFGGNFANCVNVWDKWTIEFRSHEGTKNSNGLEFWVKLLMRLFDEAVASDWDYIMYLCDSSESFNAEGMCGDENDRELYAWRVWVLSMHHLFLLFLAGPILRDKYMDPLAPQALEENILSQPPQMTDEEYSDDNVRPVREEEMLLQNLINYMTEREYKFSPQYERFMEGNFQDWSSDNVRDDLPGDWVDYPNPSGKFLITAGTVGERCLWPWPWSSSYMWEKPNLV